MTQNRKNKRKTLTSEEIKQLIESLKNSEKTKHFVPFVTFLAMSGCKPDEAARLKCYDVHFRADGEVLIESTEGKIRYLPLTNQMRELLEPQCKDRFGTDLVFPSPTGEVIDDRNLKLGLDFQILRDSFVKRALDKPLMMVDVAYLIGESPFDLHEKYREWISCKNHPPMPEF